MDREDKRKDALKDFYEYRFDDKRISFYKDNVVKVQIGRDKSSYKDRWSFAAKDFAQAVFYYNSLNIGKGYKKRLWCDNLNKPLLARQFS